MKTTLILQHRLVRIEFDGTQHRVFIAMSRGGYLEHNPFPGDLRGLVSAMTLATDCLAGKFFPLGIHLEGKEKTPPRAIADGRDLSDVEF
jgi:hypothetical protein